MIRSQRFLLQPTKAQADYFRRAAGLSRYAYNWGLARCRRFYALFGKYPGLYKLQKHWTKFKNRKLPWVKELSKFVAEGALDDLDRAYQHLFAGANKPRFKSKKKTRLSFMVGRGDLRKRNVLAFVGRRILLSLIGTVRCSRPPRWPTARPLTARIKEHAGRWYLTVQYELTDPKPDSHTGPTTGVDLGCTTFATVTSGGFTEKTPPPKPYAKTKWRLRRAGRTVSRRKPDSNRRKKAVLRLAKLHKRVADVRSNFLHQLTRRLVKTYGTVVIEDLAVKAMSRGILRKTIADLGFGEFRRQLTYKAEETSTRVVVAPRFYPSSKTCSRCGGIKDKLGLDERVFRCSGCKFELDRDENAARNLEQLGRGTPEVTPAETRRSAKATGPRRCRSKKREHGIATIVAIP